MSAEQRARERGRKVPSRTKKWDPDHVDYPGRLVVGLRNTETDGIERIEKVGGKLWFRELGHLPDGSVQVYPVRDRELAKRATAMLEPGDQEEVDAMITEAHAKARERLLSRTGNGTKVKRGSV